MTQTKSRLILTTTVPVKEQVATPFVDRWPNGIHSSPIYGKHANMNGDESFYVVYSGENYNSEVGKEPKIIDQKFTINVDLGFDAKSIRGWDKDGITLFTKTNYGGSGGRNDPATFYENTDISEAFPSGIKSFIVQRGTWSLCNKDGQPITFDNDNEFHPGKAKPNIDGSEVKFIKLTCT